jgi:hypothetical protein
VTQRARFTGVVALGAWLLAAAGSAVAQSSAAVPPLVTDRPGFGESSEVVGHGVVQLESGLTLAQVEDGQRQITVPELLVRFGIGRRFELRIAGDGYVARADAAPGGWTWTHGHSDLELGGKLKLLDAAHGADLAVIPFLSLPTASPGFSTARYDPGFKIAVARGVPLGFDVSATYNTADATSDSGRAWEQEASLALDHPVRGAMGAFGEVDGQLHDGRCDCSVDAGVAVAMGPDGQFDLAVGRRVSGAAQDWFVGVGFSIRHRRR